MIEISLKHIDPSYYIKRMRLSDNYVEYGTILFIIFMISALIITLRWGMNAVGPVINIGSVQHDKILTALETICRVDESICEEMGSTKIQYHLVNDDYIRTAGRPETAYIADGEATITLYPEALENDAFLNVQLYHRMLHVTSEYIQGGEWTPYHTCLEHNRVKKQTYEYAQTLDAEYITEGQAAKNDHIFYASGWDNAPEVCTPNKAI